ncbi:MAG: hypothetical protein KBT39_09095 [Bacteroidales bacterium]|nr:hypothetical protein [Bacteroidales bacterium]
MDAQIISGASPAASGLLSVIKQFESLGLTLDNYLPNLKEAELTLIVNRETNNFESNDKPLARLRYNKGLGLYYTTRDFPFGTDVDKVFSFGVGQLFQQRGRSYSARFSNAQAAANITQQCITSWFNLAPENYSYTIELNLDGTRACTKESKAYYDASGNFLGGKNYGRFNFKELDANLRHEANMWTTAVTQSQKAARQRAVWIPLVVVGGILTVILFIVFMVAILTSL